MNWPEGISMSLYKNIILLILLGVKASVVRWTDGQMEGNVYRLPYCPRASSSFVYATLCYLQGPS